MSFLCRPDKQNTSSMNHLSPWVPCSRRRNVAESPAVRESARIALHQAGLFVSDLEHFDIYSCFPSAVQIAMKEIGIKDDDPRPLTVTGGLPFFGGPGNNYSMHAIVSSKLGSLSRLIEPLFLLCTL